MRRFARSLVALLALLALASRVHASAGVNLRWDQCLGDGGVPNRNFACNTNAGSEALVGSFVLASDFANATGLQVTVLLAVGSAPLLPAWWEFKNAGTCRAASLSYATNSTTAVACLDWGIGVPLVGALGGYAIGIVGPNTARIVAATAATAPLPQPLAAAQEYFGFILIINHQKTVGAGSCAGCSTPACLLLKSVTVTTQPDLNNMRLFGPTNGTDSDFATWQGGSPPAPNGGPGGCPGSTPTKQRTWGAVKALYR